uniref:Endoribonuclease Dicer-like 2a n=1 Tax=Hirondellea gigas TaxID=1518452 RepID=A0A6A7FQH9_9CRUS
MTQTPLRRYQQRIVDEIGQRNAIVVLPTGSGKTLIATAKISKKRSDSFDFDSSEQNLIMLFVVPTRDLVRQQSSYLEREVPKLRIVSFVSDESKSSLKELLSTTTLNCFDILVTTPAALLATISNLNSSLSWDDISMLVLDECHHTTKHHPYRKMISHWQSQRNRCQLIGLTASCSYKITEKSQREDIERLCGMLHTNLILTANSEEMINDGYHASEAKVDYATSTRDISLQFDFQYASVKLDKKSTLRNSFFRAIKEGIGSEFTRKLVEIVRSLEDSIQLSDSSFRSPIDKKGKGGKLKAWGKSCEKRAKQVKSPTLARQYAYLRHWYEALRLVIIAFPSPPVPHPPPTDEIAFLYLAMMVQEAENPFDSLRTKIERCFDVWQDTFLGVPGRLQRLTDVLDEQYRLFGTSIRIVIFVQHQIAAHVLKFFLQHEPIVMSWAKPVCIHSTNTSGLSMSATDVKLAISAFRTNQANILVATSVAEEGMDIPACNVVVRFDPIQTPVSMIQSRGRARQENSAFVVMEEMKQKPLDMLLEAETLQKQVLKDVSQRSPQLPLQSALDVMPTVNRVPLRASTPRLPTQRRPAPSAVARGNSLARLNKLVQKQGLEISTKCVQEPDTKEWIYQLSVGADVGLSVHRTKKQAKLLAADDLLRKLGKR